MKRSTSSASKTEQELVAHLVEVLDGLYIQMRLGSVEDWPQVELTMPQLRALFLMNVAGPLRMMRLASFLDVGLPSATSMVDRLVEKGLVERAFDPEDRRGVICRLTEKGRQETEGFWHLRRESIGQLVEILSAEEVKTVINALETVVRAMRSRAGSGEPRE